MSSASSRDFSRRQHIIAVSIGILPVYIFAVLFHIVGAKAIGINELLMYPMILGGGVIVFIILLQIFYCRENINNLNFRKKAWYFDILSGLLLYSNLQYQSGFLHPRPKK
jgi:hypothetical protein